MGCSSSYTCSHVPQRFQRTALARKPAYDIIIGNLSECKECIENNTFKQKTTRVKEELEMFCVINPPRQGKSLLLDQLYSDEKDKDKVLVIEITYNSKSCLLPAELKDYTKALQYFWLRVLKSVLSNTTSTLDELQEDIHSEELNLSKIRKISRKHYGHQYDPFLSTDGSEKMVLICVDEFSLVTDDIRKLWKDEDQKVFVNSLHNSNTWKVRFVLTGFNSDMKTLLQSSARINKVVLTMCSFRSSKPLLKLIQEKYEKRARQIPIGLFECIKCSPGLVGLWAERVNEGRLDSNLVDFCFSGSQWFEVMSLVSAQLGLGIIDSDNRNNPSRPQVIPICMVYLAMLMNCKPELSPLRKLLLIHLNAAVVACEPKSPDKKDGTYFETFVYHALHCRLVLRHPSPQSLSSSVVNSRLIDVPCSLDVIFPSRTFTLQQRDKSLILHQLTSKEHLQSFLLTPLYYLFPVGVTELERHDDNSGYSRSQLTAWLDEDCSEYQVSPLQAPNCQFNLRLLNRTLDKFDEPSLIQLVIPIEHLPHLESISESDRNLLKEILTSDDKDKAKLKEFSERGNGRGLLITGLQSIMLSIRGKYPSILKTARAAEGVDLIVVWVSEEACFEDGMTMEENSQLDNDEMTIASSVMMQPDNEGKPLANHITLPQRKIVHVAAVELKDRKSTTSEEWRDKVEALLSKRCLV